MKWKMNKTPRFKRNKIFSFDNKWAAWFFGLILISCLMASQKLENGLKTFQISNTW